MTFIGRERELRELNDLYGENRFGLFVLYGRRRVGKTTLLGEFCKNKDAIFYSAEQSNPKLNLENFSRRIFEYYGVTTLAPFTSWTNALTYVDERQSDKPIVLIIDEFPYIIRKNRALLSEFQHLIDHRLSHGKIFLVLCGSCMSVMEKDVLGSESPLFGRRTGQLHMKPLDYRTSLRFIPDLSPEEQLLFFGAYGGTPLYLSQIRDDLSFEDNIKRSYLRKTAYLYEEPLLLLRQEVSEPGVYNAIIRSIASGASKSNEISTAIGEESAKCLKYINILCELGILYKETPFGEKETARKTLYRIADPMFRFWYRYVFRNRSLIEMNAIDAVWEKHILPDYSHYMGSIFEKVCLEYLMIRNARGELPFLFTSIGRWWGTNPATRAQIEIDLVANEGQNYLFGECKWTNDKTDTAVVRDLRDKADVFRKSRGNTWFILFSKNGFTEGVLNMAKQDPHLILVTADDVVNV